MPFFDFFAAFFDFFAILCCGGLFATTPAARSNLDQASECSSISFSGDFAMLNDPWISRHSNIAPEKLHALGVINYRWNLADIALKGTLAQISRIDFTIIWAIIHEMGDLAISSAIAEIVRTSDIPPPVRDSISHGLKLYDRNRINRNQLTHFLPSAIVGSDLTRLKGPKFDPKPLPDDIYDLRRVAEDIESLLIYFSKLMTVVSSRQYSLKPGGTLPPLPDTIPLPELLVTPLPQKDRERNEQPGKAPEERRPSVPRLTEEEWIAKYRKDGRPLPEQEQAEPRDRQPPEGQGQN